MVVASQVKGHLSNVPPSHSPMQLCLDLTVQKLILMLLMDQLSMLLSEWFGEGALPSKILPTNDRYVNLEVDQQDTPSDVGSSSLSDLFLVHS